MPLALLNFAGVSWWVPVLLLAAVLFPLAWFALRPAQPGRGASAVGLGLRGAGVALLLLALLDPQWVASRAKRGANIVAVVADNSLGLTVAESDAVTTRGDMLAATLNGPNATWLDNLRSEFQVRSYVFGESLQRVRDFSALDFRENRSDLRTALSEIRERLGSEPLAGIVVLTDGNATDLGDADFDWTDFPPLHVVAVGETGRVRDMRLTRTDLQQTEFDDAPVSLRTAVGATGLAGQAAQVRIEPLLAGVNNSPSPRTVRLPDSNEADAEVDFAWRPDGDGVQFYAVNLVAAPDESIAEATRHNNRRYVMVDRGRPTYRILYLGGRPNWEFKFLNRALQRDAQLDLVGLIRLARREPKFEFRGRAGESNNPLFRGFDREGDAAPRYDEPVLTRINTRSEEELRNGFPRDATELFSYDAVILDDVEAEFFTSAQQLLLRRFVSERGGGLLMLGGIDTLGSGGYAASSLASALPVYLDRQNAGAPQGDLRWELTREGWLEPWARVRPNAADERDRLAAMPAFLVGNGIASIKPGATLLATLTDDAGTTFPGLAAQRFGSGRVAVLAVGDLWRWGMVDGGAREDLARFWRQLTRWLVTDVPERVQLRIRSDVESAPDVVLQVDVKDEEHRPLDLARVVLTVERLESGAEQASTASTPVFTSAQILAEPVAEVVGRYEARFTAREPGGYRVTAIATDRAGKSIGQDSGGWVHDPLAAEFAALEPNVELFTRMARESGGSVTALRDTAALNALASRLVQAPAPITETRAQALWHSPWVFLLVLGCFLAEWVWRRWKGLP